MDLRHLILLISALMIGLTNSQDFVEDFCTMSGQISGFKDFSSIHVHLFNKNGNLKEKTEVSETGFFVLPIYDKGDYIIKVQAPNGYSFDPDQISFTFDGDCTQKKEVNFAFKGFGITGKVSIFNERTAGAKGVAIELFNDKNQVIRRTKTDENGVFTFSPIVPGSYKVIATHDSWHFEKSEHSVTVSTGNTELPAGSLRISGFNLVGRTAQPMGFLIYSANNQKNLQNCLEQVPSGDVAQTMSSSYESKPLCFTSSGGNGQYSFGNLATGKYLIIPHVAKNDIELHISPAFVEAEIKNDNTQVGETFEVSGFSASGRVLLSQNKKEGIKGAIIKLNGAIVATTDANGGFLLKNIKDGSYNIQVAAKDLQFQDTTVKISMTNPKIPEIYVSGFKVCGKVVSEQIFKVAIKKHGSTFYTEAESDPKDGGSFCTFLGNGKYSVEVLISEAERKSVQFYPIQHPIEVNSEGVTDIIFSQLRAKVTGEVSCLAGDENPCKSVEVTLSSLDETGYPTSSVKGKVTNGVYSFEEILPGRYQLSVPSDSICWEKHQQNVVVKSALEKIQKFTQSGYKLAPIISSHDAEATYKLRSENSKTSSIHLTAGSNTLCVPVSGTYDLKVTGCHKFEEDSKVLSTKSSSAIYINAVKHSNGIRILSEMSQQFSIDAEFEDGSKKVLKPVEQKDKVDGYVAYNINLDLKTGEKVKLSPKSEQMLFKPDQTELKGASDCVDVAFNFIATKGLVITGKTEPLIADAIITLSFPKNPELSPMLTSSSSIGEFRFPTIDPTIDYELKAEKESYIFSDFDASRNLFHGHKLCEIIVHVADESSKDLAGVVISLSGGENYRKNQATIANGEIKFHSLKPGKYYLRAMMKEYEFKPNSQTLEIKDGETVKVKLSGKRVAYSVFGKITNLGGDAFEKVKVEAISTTEACSNHQEEAESEPSGQYRIRGLQTGCDYMIRLQKNANVDRSLPGDRVISVKTTDTEDVNFIAIRPIRICDVVIRIKSKALEHYKTLKVQIFKKDSPDTPFYSQKVENLMIARPKHNDHVMVFPPRITDSDFSKTFYIEFTTTLSDKSYDFKLPSVQFVADHPTKYFEVEFNPIMKPPETELNKNSLMALCLIFIVGFVFLKHELVFDFATNMWIRFRSDVAASKQPQKKTESRGGNFIDETEINKLAEYIDDKKKKKSKKTN